MEYSEKGRLTHSTSKLKENLDSQKPQSERVGSLQSKNERSIESETQVAFGTDSDTKFDPAKRKKIPFDSIKTTTDLISPSIPSLHTTSWNLHRECEKPYESNGGDDLKIYQFPKRQSMEITAFCYRRFRNPACVFSSGSN